VEENGSAIDHRIGTTVVAEPQFPDPLSAIDDAILRHPKRRALGLEQVKKVLKRNDGALVVAA